MELVIVNDEEGSTDVFRESAGRLNELLKEAVGSPTLLLLAGGSNLAVLDNVRPELLGGHLTVMMSDERFSDDPTANNYAQLCEKVFYERATERGVVLVDTRIKPGETVQKLGERMSAVLHEWRAAHSEERILMTQGIGPDGHTCGIMPYAEDAKKFSELFDKTDVWAVGYDAGGKNKFSLRATLTIPFLKTQVTESVISAVGAEKIAVLQKLMKKEAKLNELPAFVIRLMKKTTLFTDQAI